MFHDGPQILKPSKMPMAQRWQPLLIWKHDRAGSLVPFLTRRRNAAGSRRRMPVTMTTAHLSVTSPLINYTADAATQL